MKEPVDTPNKTALRIALTYAIVAGLWIYFSDKLIEVLAAGDGSLTLLSIIKGWGFVIVTAALLYVVVRRDLARIYGAEAEWRLLFNSVDDSIYLFRLRENGQPGQFIDVNEAAIEELGYSHQELLSMTPWDLVKPDLHTGIRQFLTQVQAEGRGTVESVHVAKSGREIPVEVSARALNINSNTAVVIIARDITERRKAEEARQEAERDKRRFYRETILAVTGGKFELGDPEDVEEWLKQRDFAFQVSGPEKMAEARQLVISYCRRQGLSEEGACEFELGIGEAVGNAVKHAGNGWLLAGRKGTCVWVAVTDQGTGIDTFSIPRVALLPGYSTKASMGLGYTIILEVSDHVELATGLNGTTVVMEKDISEVSDIEKRISVHHGIK